MGRPISEARPIRAFWGSFTFFALLLALVATACSGGSSTQPPPGRRCLCARIFNRPC